MKFEMRQRHSVRQFNVRPYVREMQGGSGMFMTAVQRNGSN